MNPADISANQARSRALPMFGDGPVPVEQDMSVKDDDSGFLDVARLLLRSWPYIRPQLLGRWWIPGDGLQDQVADNIAGSGYQFNRQFVEVSLCPFRDSR